MGVCVAEAHDMNQYHEDNEDGSNEIEIGISFHLIPFDLYVSISVTYLSGRLLPGVIILRKAYSQDGLFSERLVVPLVCEGKHLLIATAVAEGFYLIERTVEKCLVTGICCL